MSTKKKPAASAAKEPVFSKESLLKSKRFRDQRDLVSAVLEDGAEYTIEEAENLITEYMKGKVK